MESYRKTVLKIIGIMRYPFGGVLLLAFLVKFFGIQSSFAGGYFDDEVLDTAFKAFLMVEVSYWSLKYRMLVSTKAN